MALQEISVKEFVKLARENKHSTKHAIKLVKFSWANGCPIMIGNRMVKVRRK